MLALEFELLTGRYVATQFDDRDEVEWPPHPARVFSALVATWAEGGEVEAEREALEWLESLSPPQIVASRNIARRVHLVFVPVNDTSVVRQPETARGKRDNAEIALSASRESGDAKKEARAQEALARALKRLTEDTTKVTVATEKDLAAKGPLKDAVAMLPDDRSRQPRSFPSATPEDPRVALIWDSDATAEHQAALGELCGRLVRIGHSSSLVRAWVSTTPTGDRSVKDALSPDESGDVQLRVPRAGQLVALTHAFEGHRGVEPRILPCGFVTYRRRGEPGVSAPPAPAFGTDWVVLERADGVRLPMEAGPGLARTVRKALLSAAPDARSEFLSGHDASGAPTEKPHLAIVPLPYVGSVRANGAILGVALVFPREASPAERGAVMASLAGWERIEPGMATPALKLFGRDVNGGRGPGELLLVRSRSSELAKVTLRPWTWTRPATRWASATPVALDRNPGNLHDPDPARRRRAFDAAEETVTIACERIGLPAPIAVEVVRSAVLPGSVKPIRFRPFPDVEGRPRRVLVHVRLTFPSKVRGPLLLGAGRFVGLGLCRPLDDGGG